MAKRSDTSKYSDENSIPKSIRFPKDENLILEKIANSKGIPFSKLVRDCTLAHIQNTAEHEELIESLGSNDPEAIQKNFFDTLNKSNDVMLKTLTNIGTDLRKKINTVDALQRKTMYMILYYFQRELSQEEKDARQINAKKTLKTFLEELDKENN